MYDIIPLYKLKIAENMQVYEYKKSYLRLHFAINIFFTVLANETAQQANMIAKETW